MTWTDERVELLKKLWTDGLSASQIATELGGVTRNAVIGKVHRLSLSGRAKPAAAPVARARKPAATTSNGRQMPAASRPQPTMQRPLVAGNTALKPLVQPMAEPRRMLRASGGDDVVVPISLHATILTLTEQTCKWPIGDRIPRISISAASARTRAFPIASITRASPISRSMIAGVSASSSSEPDPVPRARLPSPRARMEGRALFLEPARPIIVSRLSRGDVIPSLRYL